VILGTFKYANFFVSSIQAALSAAGVSVTSATLDVVLPVGISFYTFQGLSYSIDVYRGQLKPSESLLDFSLYVAFFPQLVAGPIERAGSLIPQLSQAVFSKVRLDSSAFALIAMGAFKKVVIADNFATLVEPAFGASGTAYGPALWIATYAFAIQIYCDFSGYTDIAIGLGRLLGVELMENFRAPYGSESPSEFWRRWHISLSTWLRDYLYVPLGGN
jgi:alginate O-acetyltransferase complex protein AlgI